MSCSRDFQQQILKIANLFGTFSFAVAPTMSDECCLRLIASGRMPFKTPPHIYAKRISSTQKAIKEGFSCNNAKPQDFNLAAWNRKNISAASPNNSLDTMAHEVVWETGYMDLIQQLFYAQQNTQVAFVSSHIRDHNRKLLHSKPLLITFVPHLRILFYHEI